MVTQKTFLVTGGAGFIGSHIVDRLLQDGQQVVVIDNYSWGKEENLSQHAQSPFLTVYRRDIREDLSDIFSRHSFNGVFHLAALHKVQYSIEHPQETHDVNVNGTINLLQTCRDFGVRRFVFSSSAAAYGEQDVIDIHEDLSLKPLSPYGLHKAAAEQYCALYTMLYGLETIALRYFNAFGPRQDANSGYAGVIPIFISHLSRNSAPRINGDGSNTRDFVFIDDIVEANIRTMTAAHAQSFGKVFNIGSGVRVSVADLYKKIAQLSNQCIEPLFGPALLEIRHQCAITDRARDHFGWQSRVPFDEGLLRTYQFYREAIQDSQTARV